MKTVKITAQGGEVLSIADAGLILIDQMQDFYKDLGEDIADVLVFEKEKLVNPEKRYAWQIRQKYGNDFAAKGMQLAIERADII